MPRRLFLTLLLLISFGLSKVARADVDQEGQVWTAFLSNAKPQGDSSGLRLWLDLHVRRADSGIVHIARPGLGWQMSNKLSVWAGYAWVPVIPDVGNTVHENRFWQQLILKHDIGNWSLQSRTRFEQRLSGAGDDVGFRVREFLRASWRADSKGTYGVAIWDEVFIGLNEPDWGAPKGFDQNRLFAGPYHKVGDRMRLEMGYLLLYVDRDSDTLGHVLATNLFISL